MANTVMRLNILTMGLAGVTVPKRLITLTVTATDQDVRIFTRDANGECREVQNGKSMTTISTAVRDNKPDIICADDEWSASQFKLSVSPESALCSQGANWRDNLDKDSNTYLYYQATDYTVRCHHFSLNGGWRQTSFSEPDAFMGTSLATLINKKNSSGEVLLFFQDKAGYLCFRKKTFGIRTVRWTAKVRLGKACIRTAIAAVSLDNLSDFCVYYQDEDYKVCQLKGVSYLDAEKWSMTRVISSVSRRLGAISAIALVRPRPRQSNMTHHQTREPDLRLYFQNENDTVVEWCGTSTSPQWSLGDFQHPALPGSDVVAYTRNLNPSYGPFWDALPLVGVLWMGADQVLHQRLWAPTLGWTHATPLVSLTTFAGTWGSTRFRDAEADKTIQKVMFRVGDTLLGMQLHFTDGSATPWRGSSLSGDSREFVLRKGEDITQLMVWHNMCTIQRVIFITSYGRSSSPFGKATGTPVLWQGEGVALAGFSGAADQAVNGLMAVWSDRPTGVGPAALRALTTEATAMEVNIVAMKKRYEALQVVTKAFQTELGAGLKPLASAALDGVEKLGTSIVALHEAPDKSYGATKGQVARCKGQSKVVAERFRALHKAAAGVLERSSANAVEATRETTLADSQLERISEMKKISQAMKANAEAVQQVRQEHIQECEKAISEAQKTQKQAEGKLAAYKPLSHPWTRAILAGAIGPALFLVDWNAQVQDMNQLINSMKEYIDASKASLDAAQQALQSIEAEITHCDSIRNSLLPLLPQLRTIRLDADTLRKKNQETSNKALDIAGFLSRLSVKADTIQLGFTAQEFAQRVLDVQSVLDGRRPKGIMWDHPVRLESTLRMIVSSSVPAADVDDLM